jgi:NifB/MoaA-like Fe-S oxidoreductase
VVPVGLTKYNNMLKVGELPSMRSFTLDESRAIMATVAPWQERFSSEPDAHGHPFVYLSDEWYFVTKHPFPPARHYGDYAQIENGVGMTRKLLEDWRTARHTLPTPDVQSGAQPRRLAIATSLMAEPIMQRLARDLRQSTGLEVRLLPVENTFFGPIVTVAGLLCGQDILDTLVAHCSDFTDNDLIILPRIVLDNAGTRFLDDITAEDFQAKAPAPVTYAKTANDLAATVRAWLAKPAATSEAAHAGI